MITNYTEEQILEAYKAGDTLRDIKKKYHVSNNLIYRILHDNNIKLIRATSNIKRYKPKELDKLFKIITDYYNHPEESVDNIIAKYKIEPATFAYLERKNHIIPNRNFINTDVIEKVVEHMYKELISYNAAVDKCITDTTIPLSQRYKLLFTKYQKTTKISTIHIEPEKLFEIIKLRLACESCDVILNKYNISKSALNRISVIADIDYTTNLNTLTTGFLKTIHNEEKLELLLNIANCNPDAGSNLSINSFIYEMYKPSSYEINIIKNYVLEKYKISTISNFTGINEFMIFMILDKYSINLINESKLELGNFIFKNKLEFQSYGVFKKDHMKYVFNILKTHKIADTRIASLFNVPYNRVKENNTCQNADY